MREILKFKPNRVRRAYRGGKLLDIWQGLPFPGDTGTPEEWMASTVPAFNKDVEEIPNEGLSITEDGRILRDLIAADPERMLGTAHAAQFGQSMGILLKGLDAGDRLAIQVHPTKQQAKELFHSDFGKTEAWYILGTREDMNACIYAGFQEDVSGEQLRKLFEIQDVSGILSAMNRVAVKKGDVFLIEGGLPHAIGAGCLIIEIQEPTDITLRLERRMPSGHRFSDFMCHNGAGFDNMFRCINCSASDGHFQLAPRTAERAAGYTRRTLISYEDTPAFALEEIRVHPAWDGTSQGRFSLLAALDGSGSIAWEDQSLAFQQGEHLFIPADCERFTVTGDLTLLRCFPPQT